MNQEAYKIAYENVIEANKMLEQEIERLKEQLNDEIQEELKQSEIMVKKQEEIERLTLSYEDALEDLEKKENIIKEARELLKNDYFEDGSFNSQEKVFELLDKER